MGFGEPSTEKHIFVVVLGKKLFQNVSCVSSECGKKIHRMSYCPQNQTM